LFFVTGTQGLDIMLAPVMELKMPIVDRVSLSRAEVCGHGEECLIGMGLLAGYQLRVDAVPGGIVEITRL
jgi:hypothetical protein